VVELATVAQSSGRIGGPLDRVTVRGVVKAYGATMALRGVDACVEAGRLALVEGANGSGKSTLLGVIGAVIQPTSGSVVYEPARPDRSAVRAEIGWLSHESLTYPDLSGRENVELVARIHGMGTGDAWARVEERFQLGAFAMRAVRTCSRGQRQRIALARALVHAPSLVLLDEPTAGLDRAGVDRLISVIREEIARGAGVVVVSHEPRVFAEIADDHIVMERGRIV